MRTLRRLFARGRGEAQTPASARSASGSDRAPDGTGTTAQESVRIAEALCKDRRYGEALAVLGAAMSLALDDEELIYAKGCTLLAWGRHWEANRCFARLARSGWDRPALFVRLGWTHLASGDLREAEACMRRAVSAAPEDWEARYGLGEVLRNRGVRGAREAFAAALAASPDNLHCLINLSACEAASGDFIVAEEFARRALRISRTSAPAWTNLGVALLLQDRLVEAGEAFERSEQLASVAPGTGDDDLNFGTVLQFLGRTHDAIEYFEQRIPQHPNAAASGHYALALLTAGRLTEGWVHYEFRWLDERLKAQRAKYNMPAWSGQAISGKTVLLRCEQGIGDVLQFIRYAPLVKSMGATVWLELRPGIGSLASAFPGVDRLFNSGEPIPDFDYYADLLSLPRVFRTTLATIPSAVPYLRAPEDNGARWRRRRTGDARLNVGLVWAGDPNHVRDRHRSIPFAKLAPLMSMEGVRWHSLQKGGAASALTRPELGEAVVDLGPDLNEYADTAAAIEALDLVVTVDTSVAHLAGALGKQVWTLLPFVADWRWMEGRDDSPWYPTMQLFRQRTPGDWDDVIERVKGALLTRLGATEGEPNQRSSGPTPGAATPEAGAGEDLISDRPATVVGMPRACRARAGIIQYLPGPEPLARSLEYYGEYLQAQIDMLKHLLAPGAVVLEVGAGIGVHTIALASMVAPGGYVLAVENSRILRRMLRQNLSANDVRCAGVIETAITGKARAAWRDDDRMASHPGELECTVDELQLDQLDLLKVGDPALAQDALDGAETTLWRHRPTLFIAQESPDALAGNARRAGAFGYRCWSVEARLFSRENFNRRNDDIFTGETALAILAVPEERDLGAIVGTAAKISEIPLQ